jgi:hypothetical protein
MQHCLVIVLSSKSGFNISIPLIKGNIIEEKDESIHMYIVSDYRVNSDILI